MSFKANDHQQLTLSDTMWGLTNREKNMLEKSWAKQFAERIFPLIDEQKFSVLYSDKASRPNTPVNVCVGALILKELFDMTDDEIVETLMFDIRFQYALHTTSFDEQPLSDKTLNRFRRRCYLYEIATGQDLIHDTIKELSEEMAKIMKIGGQIKRMDSLMVASNIRRLSRMELLYTCLSDFVTYLHKTEGDAKLAGLQHYYHPEDYNTVIYHHRNEDYSERVATILKDADQLLKLCNRGYDEVSQYQLLLRAISEQTIRDESGKLRLKTKEDGGMHSNILQNPADPEATYREKAGKPYRGYSANIVESVFDHKSIVTDYQFEQNTHSDSEFTSEILETMEKQPGIVTLVADGGFSGEKHQKEAADKNIELVTTNLLGKDTKDIYADFVFSEDGEKILSCPMGKQPKSTGLVKSTGKVRASFARNICENCPHKKECSPNICHKTSVVYVSKKSSERAKLQRKRSTWQMRFLMKVRNGVETIPSILRRKYHIDTMPVRGKIRMKHFFGFKIGALNFNKLLRYLNSLDKCAQNSINAPINI